MLPGPSIKQVVHGTRHFSLPAVCFLFAIIYYSAADYDNQLIITIGNGWLSSSPSTPTTSSSIINPLAGRYALRLSTPIILGSILRSDPSAW
jgi:hypothetical protein